MKIRTGFVSNSSSSSFIVALPHKPKDVEDIKKILFGKQEWFYIGHSYGDEPTDIATQKLAESVFGKIKKKATIKDIIESISHGYFDGWNGLPGYYNSDDDPNFENVDFNDPERSKKLDERWAHEDKINSKRAKDVADSFRRFNNDKYIVVMSFSDNHGEEVEEHSNIFERVENIRTSYH